jgi:hypothetical protein
VDVFIGISDGRFLRSAEKVPTFSALRAAARALQFLRAKAKDWNL